MKSSRNAGNALTRVLVYGTLLSGEPNHGYLVGSRLIGPARTGPGFGLYDLGHFPGLVRQGAGTVEGEVYEVDTATLAALDRLESHPQFYERTPIVLEDGTMAETYLLQGRQVAGRPRIESGNWRVWRKEKHPWTS